MSPSAVIAPGRSVAEPEQADQDQHTEGLSGDEVTLGLQQQCPHAGGTGEPLHEQRDDHAYRGSDAKAQQRRR